MSPAPQAGEYIKLIATTSSDVPAGLPELWQARHDSPANWAVVFVELRPTGLFSYDATQRPHA